jgi:hypothetical protein
VLAILPPDARVMIGETPSLKFLVASSVRSKRASEFINTGGCSTHRFGCLPNCRTRISWPMSQCRSWPGQCVPVKETMAGPDGGGPSLFRSHQNALHVAVRKLRTSPPEHNPHQDETESLRRPWQTLRRLGYGKKTRRSGKSRALLTHSCIHAFRNIPLHPSFRPPSLSLQTAGSLKERIFMLPTS